MKTYRIYWQEINGSYNQSTVSCDILSDAVIYVENNGRCDHVYRVEVVEE